MLCAWAVDDFRVVWGERSRRGDDDEALDRSVPGLEPTTHLATFSRKPPGRCQSASHPGVAVSPSGTRAGQNRVTNLVGRGLAPSPRSSGDAVRGQTQVGLVRRRGRCHLAPVGAASSQGHKRDDKNQRPHFLTLRAGRGGGSPLSSPPSAFRKPSGSLKRELLSTSSRSSSKTARARCPPASTSAGPGRAPPPGRTRRPLGSR